MIIDMIAIILLCLMKIFLIFLSSNPKTLSVT